MYRGELDLGAPGTDGTDARSRAILPGPIGALLEKDLRIVWRDPRQNAVVLSVLVSPLALVALVLLCLGLLWCISL